MTNKMPNKRAMSPLTTWHSQAGLLWISWTWGLSYVVPPRCRIPFAEVFPNSIVFPMWVWGALMLAGATVSLIAERVLRHTSCRPWHCAWAGHALLAATYFSLALGALVQGLAEISAFHFAAGSFISAISRPVLWGYVGYLHTTYARLPRTLLPGTG